ncbi:2-pyrone-4,6-dicarbaxylate hydrolase [Colletotrichum trifolii]|uniref:2-pyrone-4,6-dicarbaxylate hydrolase n=1 Tax=Colletotrichum trifolii TaxID=5466 RepID=A0A4R8QVA0_COLTR|nr:2-pyrone-4,6-dicarbaxylate hydrolase [Colletotrichum trifolii]
MEPTATSSDGQNTTLFPRGGWDTHHHIFEPETFPYSPDRHLTPPAATVASFDKFKKSLGITRSVLTHGLSYGDDSTSLKAFVPRLGSQKTRAIGVINPETTTDDEMQAMHDAGVRGLRVNLYQYKAMEDVELQKKALRAHLQRITASSLPWSLTMTTTRTDLWDELEPFVRTVVAEQGVRLVTDHFALLKASSSLPRRIPRRSQQAAGEREPAYADVRFLVRAFIDANKHGVLWGSDWPHTPRMEVRTREAALAETPCLDVDDAAWLRSLKSWLTDEEWELLMVQNPAVLFA